MALAGNPLRQGWRELCINQEIQEGETVLLTLATDGGGAVMIEAVVRKE